jgi:hypothetical protein
LLHCVSDILYIVIFSLLISIALNIPLYGQLKFENLQTFELEIDEVSDLANRNYWKLDPSDHELSRLFGITELRSGSSEEGHYILQRPDGHYLAYHNVSKDAFELFRFRFENTSGKTIDRVQVGLDLAVLLNGNSASDLLLQFQYGSVSGSERLLSSNQFRRDGGEWNKTSINTMIEDLLVDPGETIEFSIKVARAEGTGPTDEFALQRVEIRPDEFRLNEILNTADLVITEIFPGSAVEGERLHYIELYNTTNETIDLRGLNLRTGEHDYRLRQSVEILPYQWAVISNREIEHIGFHADLVIPGFQLPAHGGMIELIQNEQRIMRAAYDAQSGNRAWELEGIYDVMDGYASLNKYRASDLQFSRDLYGSPGSRGSTKRVFTYDVPSDQGWLMISPPGSLISNLPEGEGYWTGKEYGGIDRLPPGSGLLTRFSPGEDADKYRLKARESDSQSLVELNLSGEAGRWLLLGNPYEEEITLSQVVPENGSFESYTAQVWDPVHNTFLIQEPGSKIEPWQAFIVKNRDAESVRFERDENLTTHQKSILESRSRAIRFELSLDGSRESNLKDQAAILYFHEKAEHGSDPLDTGKLWPFFANEDYERSSIIYFIGQENGEQIFLAQDARPFDIDQPFELRMGHIAYNVSGTHTLRWQEFRNIPDTWEVKITDLKTGQTVNMREEQQLTFDASANLQQRPELSDNPGIHPVNTTESFERFAISVNPDPYLRTTAQDSDTRPDRVELYQNYPNPFNPATNIRFYLPEQQPVVIGVYNVVGQRVTQLLDETLPPGEHTVVWDGTEMPSGIYIIHLEIGNRVLTRKMTLIK